MKNIWKSLLVAGVTALSLTSSASAATPAALTDINNSYAKDQITQLYNAGIISGDENHRYNPTSTMTRQQIAVVLCKSLGLTPDATAAEDFTDVAGWAKPYVGTLVKAGIAKGYDAKTFGGNDAVTREQLAVIFVRAFKADNLMYQLYTDMSNFTDNDQIDAFAYGPVIMMEKIGFLNGYSTAKGMAFNPKGNADRQAVAHLVSEFYFNKDAYTAKLNSFQEILDLMKPTGQAMQAIHSVSLTHTETAIPSNEKFPPLTEKLDMTLSPFTAHGTIQIESTSPQSSEWYIANGIMYYQANQSGQWYKENISSALDQLSGSITQWVQSDDLWVDPGYAIDSTLTSDASTDTVTRNPVFIHGPEDQYSNPYNSDMFYTTVIDKQTHLVKSSSYLLKDHNNALTNLTTYDHYNAVQPIEVPITIKDTAIEPDMTHANATDPEQELQLFQQFMTQ